MTLCSCSIPSTSSLSREDKGVLLCLLVRPMILSSVLECWYSLRPNSKPSPLHFELLGYQIYIHSFSVFSRAQVSPLCSNSVSPPAYLMSPLGHLKNISDLHSIFKMELRAPPCFSSTIPISVNYFAFHPLIETRNLEVTYLSSKIPLLYPTPPHNTHTSNSL